MYQILLAEPFWVPHAEIGELTDWHVWEQYIVPTFEAQRNRDDDEEEGDEESPSLPSREEYVQVGLQLGGTREQLETEYDRWAATEEGQRFANEVTSGDDGDT